MNCITLFLIVKPIFLTGRYVLWLFFVYHGIRFANGLLRSFAPITWGIFEGFTGEVNFVWNYHSRKDLISLITGSISLISIGFLKLSYPFVSF